MSAKKNETKVTHANTEHELPEQQAVVPADTTGVEAAPLATEGAGEEVRISRKITTKAFVGGITQDLIPDVVGQVKWLGLVYGTCTGIGTDVSTFGDFLRLYGDFVSESHITGELSQAGQAILPSLAESAIRLWVGSEYIGTEVEGKPGKKITPPLQITIEIGIEAGKPEEIVVPKTDTTPEQKVLKKTYQWTVRPIGGMVRESPALLLRRQMKAALARRTEKAALASPEKAALASPE